ncbi:MAG TPA: hypothetical protein VGC34_09935 [Steroidobacteraceae bacterium]
MNKQPVGNTLAGPCYTPMAQQRHLVGAWLSAQPAQIEIVRVLATAVANERRVYAGAAGRVPKVARTRFLERSLEDALFAGRTWTAFFHGYAAARK